MLNPESSRSNNNKIVNNILEFFIIVGVGLAYYGAAEICLNIASTPENVTLIWPSGGIAVAAVLMLGNRALLGALLGELLTNVSHFFQGTDLSSAIASAIWILSISVSVVLSYWFSGFFRDRTIKSRYPFHRIRDVFKFLTLVVILPAAIGTTLAVTSV
ncbi:MAG: MASE1 domain-containing protein, partial [Spirulina sp.]